MPFKFNPFTHKLDIVESITGAVSSITGNAGGAVSPDPATDNINLVGAGGVVVTGNPGTHTLTITVGAFGMTWNNIAASQTLAVDNGYFCTGGGALVLLLPAVSNVGDTITVCLDGSASFQVTQNAGQTIKFANATTTAGVGGSIMTTQQGDTIEIVCSVANLRWNVIAADGNFTIV